MKKESILDHFQGNFRAFYERYISNPRKASGDEFKALCPFHEETKASFNFSNQKGVFNCHGCGAGGDVFDFYGRMKGLDPKGDFPKILEGIGREFGIKNELPRESPPPWKRPVDTTYDYTDALGKMIFQVVRFSDGLDPKFMQRRPNNKDGWDWNLKGVKPTLYRLPEITDAQEVFVVEGEKDVDNLRILGLAVTTSPMGAGIWRDEYSQILMYKHVVLIPDNDDAGRRHMQNVARSLHGIAAWIKMLELPGVPEKGDVSDWLKQEQSQLSDISSKEEMIEVISERFALLVENTEEYEPPKPVTIENAILEANQFVEMEMPEKRRIISPWLSEQGIALVSGWRGVGKTFFCMGLCNAITAGQSFGPWECLTPVPCLYLEAEMPQQDVKERLLGMDPGAKRVAPLYIYSDAHASELGLKRANLNDETWRAQMKQFLLDREIKFWVVDNLASLTPRQDENTKTDWDPINQWLLELRFAGISTAMAHHTNKEGGQRGTSAREDNIDISIVLKSTLDYVPEDGAKFIVHFTKARIRTADLKDIADTQFQLAEDDNGRLVWTWANVKRETRIEVLRLVDEGHKQAEVAELVGHSRGYVSKIIKRSIADNLLTSKMKLTQRGFCLVHGVEKEETF